MLIKICGLKFAGNLKEISSVLPDLVGFIFYRTSPRYAGNTLMPSDLYQLPAGILKVGVFVNEETDMIRKIVREFQLDIVQLHGNESPFVCDELKPEGIEVMKAFRINDDFNFARTIPYARSCRYFLFDAAGRSYGGNGKNFNWNKLKEYTGKTPFFLSGGINPGSMSSLLAFYHPFLAGIDLNSGFETEPGLKDADQLKNFIKIIRQ